jgi:hypothetical protein
MKPRHKQAWLLAAGGAVAVIAWFAFAGSPRPQHDALKNSHGNSTRSETVIAQSQASDPAPSSASVNPSYAAQPDGRAAGSRPLSLSAAAAAPLPAVQADAADSLATALRDGDERSPPILRDTPPLEPANAAELADPAAYRRYENRQQARLYRAFEQEAVIALADMQQDLQRGRAAQLPPEQLAEGEEKARMLAETLRRLRQGELQPQP